MPARTHKGRPKQPKCPHCKKPLFKRMDAGQVQKTDPYGWCRNEACDWFNKSQTDEPSFTPLPPGATPKTGGCTRVKKGRKPAPKARKAKPKAEPPRPGETEAVTKARARIRSVVDAAEAQFGANTIGLALAIVSQETGNQDAANLLIKEYNLTELFGIQPLEK